MRLLVANPNTSDMVTEIVATAARVFASPESELAFVTAELGARVMASRTEIAIAHHAIIDLVARRAPGFDGVLIAASYDPGLRAARELLGIPVMALTEASLLAALTLGTRIGLIIWGRGAISIHLEIVDSYGLGGRICGTRKLDVEVPGDAVGQADMKETIVGLSQELIDQCDAEVIVLMGAVLSGYSVQVQDRIAAPVLDGVRCAIPMLEAMVRIGAKAPKRGSYAMPGARESSGLSSELRGHLLRAR